MKIESIQYCESPLHNRRNYYPQYYQSSCIWIQQLEGTEIVDFGSKKSIEIEVKLLLWFVFLCLAFYQIGALFSATLPCWIYIFLWCVQLWYV